MRLANCMLSRNLTFKAYIPSLWILSSSTRNIFVDWHISCDLCIPQDDQKENGRIRTSGYSFGIGTHIFWRIRTTTPWTITPQDNYPPPRIRVRVGLGVGLGGRFLAGGSCPGGSCLGGSCPRTIFWPCGWLVLSYRFQL